MGDKAKTIIAVFIMIGVTIAGLFYGINNKQKENEIEKKIAKMNISKAHIIKRDGYEQIDTRYLTVGKEKIMLTREFRYPRQAINQFKARYPEIIKKLRAYWACFGDMNPWNMDAYREAAVSVDTLTGEEAREVLGFFDIYENHEENRQILKEYQNINDNIGKQE